MAGARHDGPGGPRPPPPAPAGRKARGAGGREHTGPGEHAREGREPRRGGGGVERHPITREQRLAVFHTPEMLVVRSWLARRPLEPAVPAAALIAFPRDWTTRRGRYCRFAAPGAGVYGLLRARPTF